MRLQSLGLGLALLLFAVQLAADGPDLFDIHFNRNIRQQVTLPPTARALYRVKKLLSPVEEETYPEMSMEPTDGLDLPQGQRQIGREAAVKRFEILQASQNLALEFQPYGSRRRRNRPKKSHSHFDRHVLRPTQVRNTKNQPVR